MGSLWFQNLYLGRSLPDSSMRDIPYPLTELVIHVTTKTVQAFSLLGAGVVGPAVYLARTRFMRAPASSPPVSLLSMSVRYGLLGALAGVPAGPLLTRGCVGKLEACNDPDSQHYEAVYDRVYRLRYNGTQVRCDRYTTVGMLGGAVVGAAAGGMAGPGALAGLAGSLLVAVALNSTQGPPSQFDGRRAEKLQLKFGPVGRAARQKEKGQDPKAETK